MHLDAIYCGALRDAQTDQWIAKLTGRLIFPLIQKRGIKALTQAAVVVHLKVHSVACVVGRVCAYIHAA